MERFQAERRRQKRLLILSRRRIRDIHNPFDLTYQTFVGTYRLSQDLALSLVDLVRPHIRATRSPLALPLELKVLCALNFYATGSYQMPTGKGFDYAVAQPTVCTYIAEVTAALNHPAVLGRMVRFPQNQEEMDNCILRNNVLGGRLPNVVGYCDGSLIKIRKPSLEDNRQAFIGRKSYASINVMFTCDRRLYVMNVVARYPGATNDSYIFHNSSLRTKMIELNQIHQAILVGDSGFALEPWMMTPFERQDEPEEDTPEARYNHDHAYDRNPIERAIGVMKERFRAINDERVLHYHHIKSAHITIAVTVLHNMCVLAYMPNYLNVHNARNLNVNDQENEEDYIHVLNRGRAVRQEIVQHLEATRHRHH